ncbi:MAG: 16S rRNA (cytosine(1402)-N(4))-methyltransferase RsmH [Lachnospiraceae bacterium]|jgi:16S rRNA (cytosine1402-N4)-methyltransferase|nr:16S rRNA (cytosine(1402)-N(4))-methyltransferase RsmH [Lachnospiraceae bacterium]
MMFEHKSVLLEETIDSLNIRAGGIYVDGTLGGGGHAWEVLRHLKEGQLIGIDQDADAIQAAKERLAVFGKRAILVRSNYEAVDEVLNSLGIGKVDGIYLDLGVSSYQLDTVDRGFTYRDSKAPLDMRMDQRATRTAADLVNTLDEAELARILWEYGEERFSRRIAANIIKARQKKTIETAGELVEIIRTSIPMKLQATGGHPAKRTFQALRIELNQELAVLEQSIDRMIERLTPGGRLSIITFHSLEDRIVKNRFRENENPCQCPPEFPVCVCGRRRKGRVVTRKPIVPTHKETEENPRAKSAKLRVFERGENK